MDSGGIGSDIRRLLLRRDVFALAVAVVIGMSLFQLFYALVTYVAMPLGGGLFHKQAHDYPESAHFYVTFHGYAIYWSEVLALGLTLSLAVLLALFLRTRWFSFEDVSDFEDDADELPEFEEDTEYRICQECLSEVPATARRCAYCTSQLQAISPEPPRGQ